MKKCWFWLCIPLFILAACGGGDDTDSEQETESPKQHR